MGSTPELVFAGATSFMRRNYSRDLEGVDIVVSGVPYDLGTTYRPGSRLGPRAIRQASANLAFGGVWPWNLDPFDTLAVTDWGDVVFDEGYPDRMVQNLARHAEHILEAGPRMLTLGGDHFISLALLRAHAAKHGPIAIVHFDAHTDTWIDERYNHGSVFYNAIVEGLIDVERSIQVGIRTHNSTDHGIEILTAPWVHDHGCEATAEAIARRAGEGPTYLTFDIDCLDPAFAPGTGTPVIGGLSTSQAQRILYSLAVAGVSFVGADFVEVSPPYDHAELASLAAATLALDWLCLEATIVNGLSPTPYSGGQSTRAG
jgi:agmatinase